MLDYESLSPFVITERINDPTFFLDLPSNLRLHAVLLWEHCHINSIPNRFVLPPPPLQLLTAQSMT
jgi:hypothetical protein